MFYRLSSEPAPTPPIPSTEIKITAGQLIDEYQTNEIAADHKYKGRIVVLEGKIVEVSRDPETNKPYVAVTVRGKYSGDEYIRCFFDNENELLGLVKREEVIIKGKCLGEKEKEESTSFPIILENCSLVDETEFQLIEWEVASPYNFPELIVSYKKFGYSLRFHLTNPEGIKTSTDSVIIHGNIYEPPTKTEGTVHLRLTKYEYENPLPGQYKLSVEATKLLLKPSPTIQDAKLIATETFNFSGPRPEVKITDEGSHWTPDMELVVDRSAICGARLDILRDPSKAFAPSKESFHYFVSFNLGIKNTGDLPFYCTRLIVKLPDFKPEETSPLPSIPFVCGCSTTDAGEPGVFSLAEKILTPGEEKNIVIFTQYESCIIGSTIACGNCRPVGVYFGSPGERVLTFQFVDTTGKVTYSLDKTITVPEKPPME